MNLEKVLLNKFEVSYKEYKEYDNFYNSISEGVKSTMKDKVKDLVSQPEDLEKATEFVISTQALPMMYAIDLNILKETVLNSYNMCKDIVEVPGDVKAEMEELASSKSKLMFRIEKGQAKELDPELIQKYKDRISPEAIQEILRRFKNIQDIEQL